MAHTETGYGRVRGATRLVVSADCTQLIVPNMLLASEDIKQKQNEELNFTTLLPSVDTVALACFVVPSRPTLITVTFTPVIKHH